MRRGKRQEMGGGDEIKRAEGGGGGAPPNSGTQSCFSIFSTIKVYIGANATNLPRLDLVTGSAASDFEHPQHKPGSDDRSFGPICFTPYDRWMRNLLLTPLISNCCGL